MPDEVTVSLGPDPSALIWTSISPFLRVTTGPEACAIVHTSASPGLGRFPISLRPSAPTVIFSPLSSMTRQPLFAVRSFAAFVESLGGLLASKSIGRHSHQSPAWFGGGRKSGCFDHRYP